MQQRKINNCSGSHSKSTHLFNTTIFENIINNVKILNQKIDKHLKNKINSIQQQNTIVVFRKDNFFNHIIFLKIM